MKIGLFLFPIWSVKLAPLGLAYVSSALRQRGHDVTVEDYNLYVYKKLYPEKAPEDGYWFELGNRRMEYVDDMVDRMVALLGPFVKEVAKKIAAEKYDIIGISLFSSCMKFTEMVLRIYRLICPDTVIVIGGPSSTRIDADFFIRHRLADYVVYGEGEKTMCDLVEKIQKGEDPRTLPSIKYLGDDGEIVVTKRKQPMTPDEFVLPDFSDFNINDYTYQALPIMMSRGCVAACAFCNETHYWHRFRMGLVENVARELEEGTKKYAHNYIHICDSLMNGNHDLLELLVQFVLEKKMKINWGGNARFDKRLNYELLSKMKDAGCNFITFGLESASEKVLKVMGKRITMDVVGECLDNCEKLGINVCVNILVGFPGEEEEDFLMTVDYLKKRKHQIYLVNTGIEMEIAENSGVARQPTKYDILVDDQGEIVKHDGSWTTSDYSNTKEIRRDRLRRLRLALRREEMNFHPENMMYCDESEL